MPTCLLNTSRERDYTNSLVSHSNTSPPFPWRISSWYPVWTSPGATWDHFLTSYCQLRKGEIIISHFQHFYVHSVATEDHPRLQIHEILPVCKVYGCSSNNIHRHQTVSTKHTALQKLWTTPTFSQSLLISVSKVNVINTNFLLNSSHMFYICHVFTPSVFPLSSARKHNWLQLGLQDKLTTNRAWEGAIHPDFQPPGKKKLGVELVLFEWRQLNIISITHMWSYPEPKKLTSKFHFGFAKSLLKHTTGPGIPSR